MYQRQGFCFETIHFCFFQILMATLWFVFIVLVQIIFFDFNEDEMDMLISNVVNENAENQKKFNENCKQLEPTCTPTEKSALTRCSIDQKEVKSTMPISTKATGETEEGETREGETRERLSKWRDRYKGKCGRSRSSIQGEGQHCHLKYVTFRKFTLLLLF